LSKNEPREQYGIGENNRRTDRGNSITDLVASMNEAYTDGQNNRAYDPNPRIYS